jgi:hypothetical protein
MSMGDPGWTSLGSAAVVCGDLRSASCPYTSEALPRSVVLQGRPMSRRQDCRDGRDRSHGSVEGRET